MQSVERQELNMKKVKRYEDGGDVSLEKKYPDAKITKVPPNAPPERPKKLENPRGFIPQDVMSEYERKAEKFEKAKSERQYLKKCEYEIEFRLKWSRRARSKQQSAV